MKIYTKILKKTVENCEQVIDKKSMPILSKIFIESSENEIIFTATDLKNAYKRTLPVKNEKYSQLLQQTEAY